MNAYIYNADIYCEDCINKLIDEIGPSIDGVEDSDSYPQGPYPDGGGESDSPRHCGDCGVFLENPLTSDGYDYVKKEAEDGDLSDCVVEWCDYYGIVVPNDCIEDEEDWEDDYNGDEDYDDDYDDEWEDEIFNEIDGVRADDHDGPVSDLIPDDPFGEIGRT